MSEATLKLTEEISIPCPVCKELRLFVDPDIKIGKQISFFCHSKKCGGAKRHIQKKDLKNIVDKYNKTSV